MNILEKIKNITDAKKQDPKAGVAVGTTPERPLGDALKYSIPLSSPVTAYRQHGGKANTKRDPFHGTHLMVVLNVSRSNERETLGQVKISVFASLIGNAIKTKAGSLPGGKPENNWETVELPNPEWKNEKSVYPKTMLYDDPIEGQIEIEHPQAGQPVPKTITQFLLNPMREVVYSVRVAWGKGMNNNSDQDMLSFMAGTNCPEKKINEDPKDNSYGIDWVACGSTEAAIRSIFQTAAETNNETLNLIVESIPFNKNAPSKAKDAEESRAPQGVDIPETDPFKGVSTTGTGQSS
jgi:hypothetical protein